MADIHAGHQPSADELTALEESEQDPDFVKGLYGELGPGGVAALSLFAKQNLTPPSADDQTAYGKRLVGDLQTTFTVAGREGLIDQKFLDGSNPRDDLPVEEKNAESLQKGFDGSLLIPLMATDKNGRSTLPDQTQILIGNEVMKDVHGAIQSGAPQGWDHYNAYAGSNDDPYETNQLSALFSQLGKDPVAANGVLLPEDSFQTLQSLGRGSPVPDEVLAKIGPSISSMVKAGTIGLADPDGNGKSDTTNAFLGDSLMAKLVLNTADHPDQHYENFYRSTLGDITSSKHFFNDMIYSITAIPHSGMPATESQWDQIPRSYRQGLSLDESAWAKFEGEIMQDPATAAKLTTLSSQRINGLQQQAGNTKIYAANGTEEPGYEDPIDARSAREIQLFTLQNLNTAHDGLQKNLESIESQKDGAKNILGTIVGIAEDPASVTGVVKDATTDKVLGAITDYAYSGQEHDAQGKVDQVQSTIGQLQNEDPTGTEPYYETLANGYVSGGHKVVVYTGPAGHRISHDGDPEKYIRKYTVTGVSGSGIPYTESANFMGGNHKPIPVAQMNPAQLQAYEAWLHDPAIQAYAGSASGLGNVQH